MLQAVLPVALLPVVLLPAAHLREAPLPAVPPGGPPPGGTLPAAHLREAPPGGTPPGGTPPGGTPPGGTPPGGTPPGGPPPGGPPPGGTLPGIPPPGGTPPGDGDDKVVTPDVPSTEDLAESTQTDLDVSPAGTPAVKAPDLVRSTVELPAGVGQGATAADDSLLQLGRPEMSGVERQIAEQTQALEYDPARQLKARTDYIDKLAEESRLRLGRSFSMTADAKSGSAQNQFESLERGILQQKAAAQSEVLEKQGQEQRANIATLLGVQDSREQAALQTRIVDLQEQAQQFGQDLSIAELTGVIQHDPEEFKKFEAAFNAVDGDPSTGVYNADYDYDDDGTISFQDFLEFERRGLGAPQLTLAGKAQASADATRKFNEKLETAAVTGMWEGSLTMQNAQRNFDNKLASANLFGAAPPVVLHAEEFETLFNGNVVEGSPSFDYNLDANGDGTLTKEDRDLIAPRIEEDPDSGLLFYQPPGSQTIAAQQLGVEEDKLLQQANQFKSQVEMTTNQFLTSMSGYVYETGPDGKPRIMKVEEQQDGKTVSVELTTMEREQFNLVHQRYEDAMNKTAKSFYDGLHPPADGKATWEDLDKEQRYAVVGTLASMQYGVTAQGPSYGNSGPGAGDYVIAGLNALGAYWGQKE